MAVRYLLGNEGIAHACLEANIDFASGYPGTPSSEVIDVLRVQKERPFTVEWSTNEKVAFENALAAAWCGLRALCTMKHVGLNVAADPLMTSAYTGVTGGFVLLSADDPFAHSSQNEQDTRRYAHFARLPCLDPASVQEAHDMIRDAFALSEEFGLPVIFRPTTRICHSKGDVSIGEVGTEHRTAAFHRDPKQYVVIPAHTRVLHQRLNEKQPALKKRLVELGYNRHTVRGATAVVTSGVAAAYVQEVLGGDVSLAVIGAYPIDEEWLRRFVDRHEKVLVVEELAPVVEEAVRQVATKTEVLGKMTGTVPYEGEFTPATVADAVKKAGITPTTTFPEASRSRGYRPARRSSAPGACTGRRSTRCGRSSAMGSSRATSGATPSGSSSGRWTPPSAWALRSPSGAASPGRARSTPWSALSATRRSCTPGYPGS